MCDTLTWSILQMDQICWKYWNGNVFRTAETIFILYYSYIVYCVPALSLVSLLSLHVFTLYLIFSCEAPPYLLECVRGWVRGLVHGWVRGCVGGLSKVFKASHWPNSKLKDYKKMFHATSERWLCLLLVTIN